MVSLIKGQCINLLNKMETTSQLGKNKQIPKITKDFQNYFSKPKETY